ncbi:MAG: DUF4337 domain-containing protein [Candidatus Omnitrophica bacterium]|nr:DUF4337 domain-containing protein [Candidatus Omnitrophota bacterium]
MASSSNPLEENWVKWAALLTTVLAVLTAISSLKSGGFGSRVQVLTAQENNKWAYFQSKSVKQHIMETKSDLLEIELKKSSNDAELSNFIKDKLASCTKDIARYDKEKKEIENDALALSKQGTLAGRHGGNLGLAVMFFQIAIMMSSVGALLKRKWLWIIGTVFGLIAACYMLNGFYLFF